MMKGSVLIVFPLILLASCKSGPDQKEIASACEQAILENGRSDGAPEAQIKNFKIRKIQEGELEGVKTWLTSLDLDIKGKNTIVRMNWLHMDFICIHTAKGQTQALSRDVFIQRYGEGLLPH